MIRQDGPTVRETTSKSGIENNLNLHVLIKERGGLERRRKVNFRQDIIHIERPFAVRTSHGGCADETKAAGQHRASPPIYTSCTMARGFFFMLNEICLYVF